jgi:nicotinamide mononucleotide transporter PnuC
MTQKVKMNIIKTIKSFTKFEWGLWIGSMLSVTASFVIAEQYAPLTLIASLLGITSLIFTAKGNVAGPLIIIVFSLLYAVISFEQRYYGEIVTYVGMSAPIAGISAINWLKHPYTDTQVKVDTLSRRKLIILAICTFIVTIAFYFILKFFGTSSLLISTISVATSFFASALMLFRSPFYALAYAGNDIILIVLWVIAALSDISCLPMVVCFSVFLLNDLYSLYNWSKMKKLQNNNF